MTLALSVGSDSVSASLAPGVRRVSRNINSATGSAEPLQKSSCRKKSSSFRQHNEHI